MRAGAVLGIYVGIENVLLAVDRFFSQAVFIDVDAHGTQCP